MQLVLAKQSRKHHGVKVLVKRQYFVVKMQCSVKCSIRRSAKSHPWKILLLAATMAFWPLVSQRKNMTRRWGISTSFGEVKRRLTWKIVGWTFERRLSSEKYSPVRKSLWTLTRRLQGGGIEGLSDQSFRRSAIIPIFCRNLRCFFGRVSPRYPLH